MMGRTNIEFHWCVPVAGDGFFLGLPAWERPPTFEYAVGVATAAERFGFAQVLIGMGYNHHDLEAWTLASALLAVTERISAMVAVRPGFYSAPVLAKMATTLDFIAQGRLSLNVVTGGRPDEQAMYGDHLDHDARYRRTREFMEICRRLWTSTEAFDYAGEFHNLRRTRLERLPTQRGGPRFYFGGASSMATEVGAAFADVYLMWGEPKREIETRLQTMQRLVEAKGRTEAVRYGLRINIVSRSTEAEARDAARAMISRVAPEALEKARRTEFPNTRRESIGQGRQWEFRGHADQDWYVEPGLWAGISIVRSGAGMALVGSFDQVAEALLAYTDLGITSFILSGYPHLEECENVGLQVLPRVREGFLARARAQFTSRR
jgi:alkanesulfonate monooxygenase